jgi:hypothetical protein
MIMSKTYGGCHCGNILVEIEFTHAPGAYNPRACDCDFCRKHGAAYVSDAQGSLLVRIKSERDSGKYHQGSGQADLLVCRNCGVLVGAFHSSDGRLYAAVNARIMDARVIFGAEQSVSPKKLSDSEKVGRWQEIWFSKVSLVHDDVQVSGASDRTAPQR